MRLPHGTCAKVLDDERKGDFINPMAGSRLLTVNNVPERLVEYPIRLSHGLCMHSQTLALLIRFSSECHCIHTEVLRSRERFLASSDQKVGQCNNKPFFNFFSGEIGQCSYNSRCS